MQTKPRLSFNAAENAAIGWVAFKKGQPFANNTMADHSDWHNGWIASWSAQQTAKSMLWQEGLDALESGEVKSCPYPHLSDSYFYWMAGFEQNHDPLDVFINAISLLAKERYGKPDGTIKTLEWVKEFLRGISPNQALLYNWGHPNN